MSKQPWWRSVLAPALADLLPASEDNDRAVAWFAQHDETGRTGLFEYEPTLGPGWNVFPLYRAPVRQPAAPRRLTGPTNTERHDTGLPGGHLGGGLPAAPASEGEHEPVCPGCGVKLQEVTYPGGHLNEEQWSSVRAGDWYCEGCPPSDGLQYRYFWKRELRAASAPEEASDE